MSRQLHKHLHIYLYLWLCTSQFPTFPRPNNWNSVVKMCYKKVCCKPVMPRCLVKWQLKTATTIFMSLEATRLDLIMPLFWLMWLPIWMINSYLEQSNKQSFTKKTFDVTEKSTFFCRLLEKYLNCSINFFRGQAEGIKHCQETKSCSQIYATVIHHFWSLCPFQRNRNLSSCNSRLTLAQWRTAQTQMHIRSHLN